MMLDGQEVKIGFPTRFCSIMHPPALALIWTKRENGEERCYEPERMKKRTMITFSTPWKKVVSSVRKTPSGGYVNVIAWYTANSKCQVPKSWRRNWENCPSMELVIVVFFIAWDVSSHIKRFKQKWMVEKLLCSTNLYVAKVEGL